ncbi:MAG: SOS response-associated peptidase [Acidimicrobiia bacterium]|nr:SOS response-associated peptidase [Acidimicrobiia bacterium]
MCGRFVQSQDPAAYARLFGAEVVVTESLEPSYNVAPTDRVYAVAEHDGVRRLGTFRWGLIPFWAEDRKIASRHINARAETVDTKPAFRDSFASRRCIVPADGFYEWERRDDGSKLPHYLHPTDAEAFALAGLWASWRDPETDERVVTCTILTTEPNEVAGRIHDRMPVVLRPDDWDAWLDRDNGDTDSLRGMLGPAPDGAVGEHPVSSLVNSVKNNVPELLQPIDVD